MIGNRIFGRAGEHESEHVGEQAEESTETEPTQDASCDEPGTDLAAQAAQMHHAAASAQERAATLREEAKADLEEAERQAEGIMARARDAAMALGAEANAAEREARELDVTAGYVTEADRRQALSGEAAAGPGTSPLRPGRPRATSRTWTASSLASAGTGRKSTASSPAPVRMPTLT